MYTAFPTNIYPNFTNISVLGYHAASNEIRRLDLQVCSTVPSNISKQVSDVEIERIEKDLHKWPFHATNFNR